MMKQSAALRSRVMRIMPSKSRITVNLSQDEHAALEHLALRLKVSKAWLARRAIVQLLEQAQNGEVQLPLPLPGPKQWGTQ